MSDLRVINGVIPQGSAGEPTSIVYPAWRKVFNSIMRVVWYRRLRRWTPVLVWPGSQVDVTITFIEDCLAVDEEGGEAFRKLFSGGLFEIEKHLHEMGISFDKGMGGGGRDWEWDWSLSGPIKVSFRGRAGHPEKRSRAPERPKPTLVKP